MTEQPTDSAPATTDANQGRQLYQGAPAGPDDRDDQVSTDEPEPDADVDANAATGEALDR